MTAEIRIPKLGMHMKQADLSEWKFEEGNPVKTGDVVLIIETDKVASEIQASASGYLHIVAEAGTTAPVGAVVGFIAETMEELQAIQKEKPVVAEVKEAPPAEAGGIAGATMSGAKSEVKTTGRERISISPLARKMAEEYKLEISKIVGTGPDGRITKEDIEREIEERKKEAPQLPAEEGYFGKRVKTTIPFKGMRKTIAEHMHRSLSVAAQATVMGELNVRELAKFRESCLRREKAIGTRITYTEILVFAVAKALKNLPIMNSSLIENEIKIWEDINIGVAVGLGEKGERGLIVPVIRNVDQKSLVEISQITKTLVEKAQAGNLSPNEVTGGTFTLTVFGAKGNSFYGTPVINQPETAILGIGRITDKPVAKDGQVVIAPIMPYSLTIDHRIIDGVVVENFMIILGELLETPNLLLL